MKLYEVMYEPLELLSPQRIPDGEGGSKTELKRVKTIQAAVVTTAAASRTEADRDEAHASFKLTAPKGTGLKYGDILKRRGGQLLKVTGDSAASPHPASFLFEQANAEQWEA